MRENRYLRDHMIGRDRARRDYRGRDGRNPYGSARGYVRDSRRGDYRMDDPRMNGGRGDYYRDGNDYNYNDYDYTDYDNMDYAAMDRDYHMELDEWCQKLKRQVKNALPKSEILAKANQMNVRFEKYDEEEFYVTVMMLMSDFPNIMQPETYIAMAKQWLEDKDSALTGSEKLSAYYYTIVKGE